MKIFCYVITVFLSITFSCCDKKVVAPDTEVLQLIVENTNTLSFGARIWFTQNPSVSFLEKKDSLVVAGKSQSLIGRVKGTQSTTFIDSVVIYDSLFARKYKSFLSPVLSAQGSSLTWTMKMPPARSGTVVLRNSGVSFYHVGTSWIGFTPTDQVTGNQSFYISADNFRTIQLKTLSAQTSAWVIDAINGSTIYAHDAGVYSGFVRMMLSRDWGTSWSLIVNVMTQAYGFGAYNLGGCFWDDTHQWYYIYENWERTRIFKVVDGSSIQVALLQGYCLKQCRFLDQFNGFMLANTNDNVAPSTAPNTYLLKTSDGGATWGTPILISSTDSPDRLWVFDANNLLATTTPTGALQFFYKSTDGGNTWNKKNIQIGEYVRTLSFLSSSVGFLKTGSSSLWSQSNIGFVYKTIDGGNSWNKVSTSKQFGSIINFTDELKGYMQDLIYGQGQILLTTNDGGITWEELLYPYDYIRE